MKSILLFASLLAACSAVFLSASPHRADAAAVPGCVWQELLPGDFCDSTNKIGFIGKYCGVPDQEGWGCCCTDEAMRYINSGQADTPKEKKEVKPSIFEAPKLSVLIPGLDAFTQVKCDDLNTDCSIPWLGQYIAGLQRYALGVVSIIGVIVLMIAGIMWLTSAGNPSRIQEAQKLIKGGLLGIGLAFGAYLILYTINPNLTVMKNINISYIGKVDLEEISASTYASITGGPPIESFGPEMMQLIKSVAQERKVDPCFLYTFVVKESGGRVNVIGHDENVQKDGVKSYRMYKASGKTYKGVAFSGFKKNDDTPVCADKEDLCLDWRFSHGIGLTQVTIFPWDNITKNGVFAKRINGKLYAPKELFNPQTSLHATVDYLAESGCGQDLAACFRKYNGSGALAEQYSRDAVPIYNECKKNGLPS